MRVCNAISAGMSPRRVLTYADVSHGVFPVSGSSVSGLNAGAGGATPLRGAPGAVLVAGSGARG